MSSTASGRLRNKLVRSQRNSITSRMERSIPDLAVVAGQKRPHDFDSDSDHDLAGGGLVSEINSTEATDDNEDNESEADEDMEDDEDEIDGDHLSDQENIVRAYKRTKLMAEEDRSYSKHVRKMRKSDRTKDVRLLFHEHIRSHPDTSRPQKGHICDGCRLRGQPAFMTGNITTQRMHIKRHHWKLYEERCNQANVPVNPRCVPDDLREPNSSQVTLDAFGHVARRWTREGLKERVLRVPSSSSRSLLSENYCSICGPQLARVISLTTRPSVMKFSRRLRSMWRN
ncbi:hypothetical protein DL93DRAFT_610731 [Clavulina sp. PMI_390]|nr:hypothetical protein DL93DRAFT_610731 [Clavulina sp. PMI_390]